LTPAEAYDVKKLLFTNEAYGEKFICVVDSFKLNGGELSAVVNLRKGDSGGPCFAVLSSGEMRLCGVVSKGNPRNGGGNIISFCYHDGTQGGDSSDEEDVMSKITKFNRVRRVRFASDDPDARRYEVADELNSYIAEHQDRFEMMKDWSEHFTWDDFLKSREDAAIERVSDACLNLEERRAGDNDDGPAEDGNKKHDKRRRNKDRAYKKRQFSLAAVLREKLIQVYSLRDAKNIFNTIMHGNVPDIGTRDYIGHSDGSNWVFFDTLPDNKLT
jgi:hypothetical protein